MTVHFSCTARVMHPGMFRSDECTRRAVTDRVDSIPTKCKQHSAAEQAKRDAVKRKRWEVYAQKGEQRRDRAKAKNELVDEVQHLLAQLEKDCPIRYNLAAPGMVIGYGWREKLQALVNRAG